MASSTLARAVIAVLASSGVVAAFASVAVVVLVLYFGVPRVYQAVYGVAASFGYAVGGLGDWARYLTFFVHLIGSALATVALGVFDRRTAYPSAAGITAALTMAGLILAGLATARGTARRSLLALDNLVAAVDAVLAAPQPLRRPLIVADPEAVTIPQMIAALRRGLGRRPGLLPVPPRLLETALRMTGRMEIYERLAGSLIAEHPHLAI